MKNERFNSAEKYFFFLIIGLNLIPILTGKFFPTLDGPAHLYNSQLINSLLFDSSKTLESFYIFNHEPVPNWTGHIILSFFNLFLPGFVAEKILLLFYMIGLPLAFRALIKTIAPENKYFSYIIFPFTYSFLFFLGFYNFSIALIFLLIAVNFWLKNEDKIYTVKGVSKLFALITLTYFSHIFVFAILVFIIGLQISFKSFFQFIDNPNQLKETVKSFLRKSAILLASSFIPLLLFFFYFYSRTSPGDNIYFSYTELIDWLKNLRPIIALSFIEEVGYTKKLVYLISIILVIVLYNRVNALEIRTIYPLRSELRLMIKKIFRVSDFWLLAAVVVLFLYFKLPDSDGAAGFVSVRLALLFFIFLILWLSTHHTPKWFGVFIVGVALFCNFKLNVYYMSATKGLNKVALDCANASQHITPNSIVLPLNYSDNWLHNHFSNYLGSDKPMIILENYELGTGYFPLKWNEKEIPNTLFGDKKSGELVCLEWKSNEQNQSKQIDYVFIMGSKELRADSCNREVIQTLFDHYTLVYYTESCSLYELKGK